MRHIALEGRCWVLGNGSAMRGADLPREFPDRDRLFPDLAAWFNHGDSVIVAPDRELVAGPLHGEHGILYAECDPMRARQARRTLDVGGHYGRPDIFTLEVRRESRTPVNFTDVQAEPPRDPATNRTGARGDGQGRTRP